MNRRRIVLLASALLVAFASPAFAAGPMTLQHYDQLVQRLAPLAFPVFPARTVCVCQTVNDSASTQVGYLNAFHAGFPEQTVNMVCVYPIFDNGVQSSLGACNLFQVIK